MDAYRIRRHGDLWQLLSPRDGGCIGVCEELNVLLRSACCLAKASGGEVHLYGEAGRLDAVFMNLARAQTEAPEVAAY